MIVPADDKIARPVSSGCHDSSSHGSGWSGHQLIIERQDVHHYIIIMLIIIITSTCKFCQTSRIFVW